MAGGLLEYMLPQLRRPDRPARRAATRLLGLTLAIALGPRDGRAQIDYRNLDDDRPVRVEDAYPVERYAFELLAPWRYSRAGGGGVHAFVPEIEYGLLANVQVGLKLPIAGAPGMAGREWGISGLRLFGLYNFNTESAGLPALSVRADGVFPIGSFAGEGSHLTAKALATRSWGRTRLHLNGAYTFGPDDRPAAVEPADRWWAGAAVDRTLFRQSALLVAELYALRPRAAEPVQLNASVGVRYQWTPVTVLDAGVSRRLGSTGPDYELTVGISRAVGIAGLIPSRR
jgi:hypothetical protein